MRRRLATWLHGDRAVLVVFGTHAAYMAVVLGWEAFGGNERFPLAERLAG